MVAACSPNSNLDGLTTMASCSGGGGSVNISNVGGLGGGAGSQQQAVVPIVGGGGGPSGNIGNNATTTSNNNNSTCSATLTGGGGGKKALQTQFSMTPKELSDNDDLATALVLDPYLGFNTHKMNIKYRPPFSKSEREVELKGMVERFRTHQDYEVILMELQQGGFLKKFMMSKNADQQAAIQEHVCFKIVLFFLL